MQTACSCLLQRISFTLQSNSSINWFKGHYQHPNTYMQLPLQMAAEREIARYLSSGKPSRLVAPVSTDLDHTCAHGSELPRSHTTLSNCIASTGCVRSSICRCCMPISNVQIKDTSEEQLFELEGLLQTLHPFGILPIVITAAMTVGNINAICAFSHSCCCLLTLCADSSLAWDVSYTSFAHPASESASVGKS